MWCWWRGIWVHLTKKVREHSCTRAGNLIITQWLIAMVDRWYTCHLCNSSCYSHDMGGAAGGVGWDGAGHLSWRLWTKANSSTSCMPLILAQTLTCPKQGTKLIPQCGWRLIRSTILLRGLVISWMIAIFLSERSHTLSPLRFRSFSPMWSVHQSQGVFFCLLGLFHTLFPVGCLQLG